MFISSFTNFLSTDNNSICAFSLKEGDAILNSELEPVLITKIGEKSYKKSRIIIFEDGTVIALPENQTCKQIVELIFDKEDKSNVRLDYPFIHGFSKEEISLNGKEVMSRMPYEVNPDKVNKINEEINSILTSDQKFSVHYTEKRGFEIFYDRKKIKYRTFSSFTTPTEGAASILNEPKDLCEKVMILLKRLGCVVIGSVEGSSYEDSYSHKYMISGVISGFVTFDPSLIDNSIIVKSFPLKKIVKIENSVRLECIDIETNLIKYTDSGDFRYLTTNEYNLI